jgi:hypothetical protein
MNVIKKPPSIIVPPPPPPLPSLAHYSATTNSSVNLFWFNNRIKRLFNNFQFGFINRFASYPKSDASCRYINVSDLNYFYLSYDDSFNYSIERQENSEYVEPANSTIKQTNTTILDKLNGYFDLITTKLTNLSVSLAPNTTRNASTNYFDSLNYSLNVTLNFSKTDEHSRSEEILNFDKDTFSPEVVNTSTVWNAPTVNETMVTLSRPPINNSILSIFNMSNLFLPLLFVLLVGFVTFFLIIMSKK